MVPWPTNGLSGGNAFTVLARLNFRRASARQNGESISAARLRIRMGLAPLRPRTERQAGRIAAPGSLTAAVPLFENSKARGGPEPR
jgi:hypothetical protein